MFATIVSSASVRSARSLTFALGLVAATGACGLGASPDPLVDETRSVSSAYGSLTEAYVDVDSTATLLATRRSVVDAVWGAGGWPTSNIASKQRTLIANNASDAYQLQLAGIPTTGVVAGKFGSADELSINTVLAGVDHQTRAYLLRPTAASNSRAVIVHAGHGAHFSGYGLAETLARFLAAGYSTVAMFMPNYHSQLPTQPAGLNREGNLHDPIFTLHNGSTQAMRVFLEPVAATLNYLRAHEDFLQFDMTGISGGGWTTVLYAAADLSIRASAPASGSLPLESRLGGDIGDEEQKHPALYANIAGYKNLYALGGYGYAGRRQLQVQNRYEAQVGCCFSVAQNPNLLAEMNAYRSIVQTDLSAAGAGQFDFALMDDNPGSAHTISPQGIDTIFTTIDAVKPRSAGLFLFDNAPPLAGQGALGGNCSLKANGKFSFLGANYGFLNTWTQVVATKNENLFFYRPGPSPTALAATARFLDDGTYQFVSTVPGGEPGAGWSHIAAVGLDNLFFYRASTGAAKIARIDSNGTYSLVQNVSGVAAGWTDVAGLPNGALFLFNRSAGSARTGYVTDAGYTPAAAITGFSPSWNKIAAVNYDVIAFYAAGGAVSPNGVLATSLLDAQGNYTYVGLSQTPVNYGANLVVGAKNGSLFVLKGTTAEMLFVDELGGTRHVQTLTGFNTWTSATAN